MTKYHAVKVRADGLTFDSRAEHRRYEELRLMESQGVIRELQVHPAYPLTVNGVKVGKYVADFCYLDEHDRLVVEDVKGVRTSTYRLKAKLMKAIHDIDILEVQA